MGTATHPRLFFELAPQAFPGGVMGRTGRAKVVQIQREVWPFGSWLDVVNVESAAAGAAQECGNGARVFVPLEGLETDVRPGVA